MDVFGEAPADLIREVTPRPGHADLLGVLKNDQDDCRNILERSSARETTMRVAAAGIAREFLAELGVEIHSYVVSIGDVSMEEDDPMALAGTYRPLDIEMSEVRCPDEAASEAMMDAIDRAKEAGIPLVALSESSSPVFCLLLADTKRRRIALRRSSAAPCSPFLPSKGSSSVWVSRRRVVPAAAFTTRSFSTKSAASFAHPTTPAGSKAA